MDYIHCDNGISTSAIYSVCTVSYEKSVGFANRADY